jgi:hypothetical protein
MGETVGCACGWSGSAEEAWTHRDQRHESRDGFPYFWLGAEAGDRDDDPAEGVWPGMMRMWAPTADEILSFHSERIRRRCWVIRTADGYSAIIEPGDRWNVQTASPEGGGCGMAAETKIGGWLLARRLIRAHRRTGSW